MAKTKRGPGRPRKTSKKNSNNSRPKIKLESSYPAFFTEDSTGDLDMKAVIFAFLSFVLSVMLFSKIFFFNYGSNEITVASLLKFVPIYFLFLILLFTFCVGTLICKKRHSILNALLISLIFFGFQFQQGVDNKSLVAVILVAFVLLFYVWNQERLLKTERKISISKSMKGGLYLIHFLVSLLFAFGIFMSFKGVNLDYVLSKVLSSQVVRSEIESVYSDFMEGGLVKDIKSIGSGEKSLVASGKEIDAKVSRQDLESALGTLPPVYRALISQDTLNQLNQEIDLNKLPTAKEVSLMFARSATKELGSVLKPYERIIPFMVGYFAFITLVILSPLVVWFITFLTVTVFSIVRMQGKIKIMIKRLPVEVLQRA